MSIETLHNVDEILNRIRKWQNLPSDAKLAEFLGVKPGTVSAWRSRKSMDYPLVLAKCREINANWLLYGEGPIEKKEEDKRLFEIVSEPDVNYDAPGMIKRIQEMNIPYQEKLMLLDAYMNIREAETKKEE